jgi:hypothetical protein
MLGVMNKIWPAGPSTHDGYVTIRSSDGRITNLMIQVPYEDSTAARRHAVALLQAAEAWDLRNEH